MQPDTANGDKSPKQRLRSLGLPGLVSDRCRRRARGEHDRGEWVNQISTA